MSIADTAPRELPHSVEAEESLLSCCILDGAETIEHAVEAGLSAAAFSDPARQTIFGKLVELNQRGQLVELDILAEELRKAGQLEAVGGLIYLTAISGREPTTIKARYFVDRLAELQRRREIITRCTAAIENCFRLPADESAEQLLADLDALRSAGNHRHVFEWDALLAFNPKQDASCLYGDRFLCRGQAAIIAAPSGLGKSVFALQLAAHSAIGRPFFGLRVTHPLRVLYVQSENILGDSAEAAQGIWQSLALTEAEERLLRSNLRVERWTGRLGFGFISALRTAHRRRPFDVVVIDPLFSFWPPISGRIKSWCPSFSGPDLIRCWRRQMPALG